MKNAFNITTFMRSRTKTSNMITLLQMICFYHSHKLHVPVVVEVAGNGHALRSWKDDNRKQKKKCEWKFQLCLELYLEIAFEHYSWLHIHRLNEIVTTILILLTKWIYIFE